MGNLSIRHPEVETLRKEYDDSHTPHCIPVLNNNNNKMNPKVCCIP